MQAMLVLCSCPDQATADTLARSLVEHRLAACVSLLPGIRSTYRWKEAVETASEALLLIKTQAARLEELKVHVLMLHPHELPEIIAVHADSGLDRYLAWVGENSAPPAMPQE